MPARSRLRPSAPPLPGAWPLLGHLPAFRADRLGLLSACGRAGDAVALRLGPWHATAMSHPALVRALLVAEQDAFRKSPALRAARAVLGDGLLTSEGEVHRRRRRLVQPAVDRARQQRLAGAVARHTARVTAGWVPGAVVDAHAAMRALTLGVAGETLFGADLGREEQALSGALDTLLDAYERPVLPLLARAAPRLPLPSLRRWQRARRRVAAVVRQRVLSGGAGGSSGGGGGGAGDLLAALLAARDEAGGLSPRAVHDEVVTLLLAGHETTASALTWLWWLLARHPGARARVEAEADDGGDGPLALADADGLAWTRACVAEALRLYPPSWAMGRQALADARVGGVLVPRGSLAIASQWMVHRDPRWWSRPEAFDPGRWDGLDPRARRDFSYFPFGGGRRRCVGEPMAWDEMVLVVATVARRWRLDPAPGTAAEPRALLTLRPAGAVMLRVTGPR